MCLVPGLVPFYIIACSIDARLVRSDSVFDPKFQHVSQVPTAYDIVTLNN